MDVGTFAQFFRYLLFSGRLVPNEADDDIVGIIGDLAKYLELVIGLGRPGQKATLDRTYTQSPRDSSYNVCGHGD